MVQSSKILTVSYGTFSCTLEGFEDPFSTMKIVAEYFRDLSAEDRYFGSEPPTPDPSVIHSIASQSQPVQVDAEVNESGLVLRPHQDEPVATEETVETTAKDTATPEIALDTSEQAAQQDAETVTEAVEDSAENAAGEAEAEAEAIEADAEDDGVALDQVEHDAGEPAEAAQPADAQSTDPQSTDAQFFSTRDALEATEPLDVIDDTDAAELDSEPLVGTDTVDAPETDGETEDGAMVGEDDHDDDPAPRAATSVAEKLERIREVVQRGAAPAAAATAAAAFVVAHGKDDEDTEEDGQSPGLDSAKAETDDAPESADEQTLTDDTATMTPEAASDESASPDAGHEADATEATDSDAGETPDAKVAAEAEPEVEQAVTTPDAAIAQPGDNSEEDAEAAVTPDDAQPEEVTETADVEASAEPASAVASAETNAETAAAPDEAQPAAASETADVEVSTEPEPASGDASAEPQTMATATDAPDAEETDLADNVVAEAEGTKPDVAEDPNAQAPDAEPADQQAQDPAKAEAPDEPESAIAQDTAAPVEAAPEADAQPDPVADEQPADATASDTVDETSAANVVDFAPEETAEVSHDEDADDLDVFDADEEDRAFQAALDAVMETDQPAKADDDTAAPAPEIVDASADNDIQPVATESEIAASETLEDAGQGDATDDDSTDSDAISARETDQQDAEDTETGGQQQDAGRPRGLAVFEDGLAREEEALERLLETTRNKLTGPDAERRRDALRHLRAAVAATEADRAAGSDSQQDEASDIEAFRQDLERARDVAAPAQLERTPRPSPLVLVSEQRVDLEDARAPETATTPSQQSQAAVEDSEDDDHEPTIRGIPLDIFRSATSFGDFADRIGASDLPDLLEAAAAYTAYAEGRPRFSRAQVMAKLATVSPSAAFSKEAGLRSFGKLLREGKILRVQDGQFSVSRSSRYAASMQAR